MRVVARANAEGRQKDAGGGEDDAIEPSRNKILVCYRIGQLDPLSAIGRAAGLKAVQSVEDGPLPNNEGRWRR